MFKVLSPQSSVLSLQSSVFSPQSSVFSPQSSVLSLQSSVLSPQSSVNLQHLYIQIFTMTANCRLGTGDYYFLTLTGYAGRAGSAGGFFSSSRRATSMAFSS